MEHPPGTTPRIFLSAGEASGDLHGAHLVRAIRGMCPEARVSCLGGPLLESAGARLIVPNGDLAVVGLFEVLRHAKSIYRAYCRIRSHLVEERPGVVVLIDFPDFNFFLGRLARRMGLKVFYYISPQVWAWRTGRVRTMRRFVDGMAVILPFEPPFYERYGMRVTYVGHPLLDALANAPSREEASERYRAEGVPRTVGLLPGSRRSEIALVLPVLLESAAAIRRRLSGVRFLLPVAPSLDRSLVEKRLAGSGLPTRVVSGDTYGVIRACDLLITVSGTVTLEAAVLGTPMIVTNRVSPLTCLVGRHLIRVPFVGLPNLIAGRRIVPEYLQEDARPGAVADEAVRLLTTPGALEEQRNALAAIRSELGRPGAADRVARLVLDLMGKGCHAGGEEAP